MNIFFRDSAESVSEIEDIQDSEQEQEEEDSGLTRPSISKETKDMMEKLCKIFPDKFVIVGQKGIPAAQRVFALNSSTPLFKIEPILTGTWLDPPKPSEDSSIGLWPGNIVSPKGTNPYVKDFVLKPPARPTDIFISNPNLKKLLTASKIKIANLEPTVFRTNE